MRRKRPNNNQKYQKKVFQKKRGKRSNNNKKIPEKSTPKKI